MIKIKTMTKYMFNLSYESPIEQTFAVMLEPVLAEEYKLQKQVEIKTICGTFRVDFLIKVNESNIIAIECDGEEYHNKKYDEWRDTMILASKEVNTIYRFRGTDIYRHRYNLIYDLYTYYPHMFSGEGKKIIQEHANKPLPDIANLPFIPRSDISVFYREYYNNIDLSDEISDEIIERKSNSNLNLVYDNYDSYLLTVRHGANSYGLEPFGRDYYQFAKNNPGRKLDELIMNYNIVNNNSVPKDEFDWTGLTG